LIYTVSHRTTYSYDEPVSISHHLLHLAPRGTGRQRCRDWALEVDPAPSVRTDDRDYFGNPVTFLTVQQSHRRLVLHASSSVEVQRPELPDAAATPSVGQVRAALAQARGADALAALEHSFPSPYVPFEAELGAWAAPLLAADAPYLAAARALCGRIHAEFRYDPEATSVATPVAAAFRLRRGVCQDFAHLAIACLRAAGLPARYVSGYLLTRPRAGGERLVGADASHAWLAVWLPEQGWVDLDPTNDLVVGEEHVTVAWGRDYGDVAPVSGTIFGGGRHEVTVAVDVMPAG
jgi:transglutaminase-like putative cysteine protease